MIHIPFNSRHTKTIEVLMCGNEEKTELESWKKRAPELFWCHAVMSLQFTHDRSFACGGTLPNLRADCSTFGIFIA